MLGLYYLSIHPLVVSRIKFNNFVGRVMVLKLIKFEIHNLNVKLTFKALDLRRNCYDVLNNL